MPNKITSLDAAMALLFHIRHNCRGASEFLHYLKSSEGDFLLINNAKNPYSAMPET